MDSLIIEIEAAVSRITEKLNCLFKLFGGVPGEIDRLTDILGHVPENLELCLLARVPDSDQNCQLATRLYKQLLPEVNLLESLLSQVQDYNSLPRDIKRQVEVSDCLLALVNVYMNYFMCQVEGELRHRSFSDEISTLEKELLSHQIDDNLRLIVANTKFCHDLQSNFNDVIFF